MTAIGFVGLGHMGAPMAHNLLKHGHHVKIFDKVADAFADLVAAGAIASNSLADVASDVDIVITMLPASQHVSAVCLDDAGLFATARPDTLFIDSSSIDVATSRSLAELATSKGFAMIDAPVSGGVTGAVAGSLTFMVGGSETSFLQAKPILECMGKTIVHAGPSGNGQAAKICNNMILGISMIAVSEGFALGKKLGLDAAKLFEISSHASAQCWSMTSYCPVPGLVPTSPANNNYKPGFTTDMMLKDLRLSQQAAQSVGAATPLGAEATALYTLFANTGEGQVDFSGIIKMIAGNTE